MHLCIFGLSSLNVLSKLHIIRFFTILKLHSGDCKRYLSILGVYFVHMGALEIISKENSVSSNCECLYMIFRFTPTNSIGCPLEISNAIAKMWHILLQHHSMYSIHLDIQTKDMRVLIVRVIVNSSHLCSGDWLFYSFSPQYIHRYSNSPGATSSRNTKFLSLERLWQCKTYFNMHGC